MTSFPNTPRLIKGGIVMIDSETSSVLRIVSLQYNPESLMRSFQIQALEAGGGGGDRSQALRLKGPPAETLKVEAQIDATDLLENGEEDAVALGVHRELAALEAIIYPTSDDLLANNRLAQSGTLEIIPMEAPLTLFVWGKQRVLPFLLTELSVTEEAHDQNLNPIRAKVSLGMRVLSVDDLGFAHKGGSLFMNYLQGKERLSRKYKSAQLNTLGIGEIP